MALSKDTVLEALRTIGGPDLSGDIVSLGMVSEVVIHGGRVYFALTVDPARARELEPLREAAERAVAALPGVEKAMVTLTSETAAGRSVPPPAPQHRGHPHPHSHPQPQPPRRPAPTRQAVAVPGIRHIVAVASGKGGVGKSTVAVNLALGLKQLGLKVGMLDADIYGPSQPRLLGVSGRPQAVEGRVLRPLEGHGLKVMSMGFLVEEDTPMIWRGPMVISALTQMLREVEWGTLDVLVVDMPPGTGDAQLTMAQQVPLSGAVIVSTPQDLALIDARKGINMFRKVDVPILGIVENMSYFLCPACGTRSDIFGTGGARREAERLGAAFLGEVPLHMAIRETSDAGRPVVATEPDGTHARIFVEIAAKVQAAVEGAAGRPAPRIIVDS
ncbi:ATP-binding protein involved in chromosome partitioning [Tepidamorphus gemmatus]|uniref:Iron-sulfur cluster carrier protein n=1 Tax=Tepidamorphus gemmatus TaxID=747076 RepID=A0A4R3MI63_9HYPH|nr:iron-sulfur cluster carrier protein ApbC [Tepidamorphus gemmatus]TCT13551.1 ATP-binding protein involved in chromosome partitioning [Tepidamorphus gemmatus]